MKLIRSKRYKTDPKTATGWAKCDFCGFSVNGGKLRKYMQYPGAPVADYSVPQKFMSQGDVMGSGSPRWNGMMVCPSCFDVPNPQSAYLAPKGDPFKADGDRPMPSTNSIANDVISTQSISTLIFTDDDEGPFSV